MLKKRSAFIVVHNERERDAVRIAGDGAIANPRVGEGRLIPVLILDTTNRPDIDEWIRLHQHTDSGDVNVQWGQIDGHKDTVALILSVLRPAEIVVVIEFELNKHHGMLVQQALMVSALYVQAGREGDLVSHDVDAPKLVVEVPVTGFQADWDRIYLRHTVKELRKRGMSLFEARRAAPKAIKMAREFAALRVPTELQVRP